MTKPRDYTVDHREVCSCCRRRINPDEKVFRCSEHATKPMIFPTEGYKYNGHLVMDFSEAIYCTDCTSRFDTVIKRIKDKILKTK